MKRYLNKSLAIGVLVGVIAAVLVQYGVQEVSKQQFKKKATAFYNEVNGAQNKSVAINEYFAKNGSPVVSLSSASAHTQEECDRLLRNHGLIMDMVIYFEDNNDSREELLNGPTLVAMMDEASGYITEWFQNGCDRREDLN